MHLLVDGIRSNSPSRPFRWTGDQRERCRNIRIPWMLLPVSRASSTVEYEGPGTRYVVSGIVKNV